MTRSILISAILLVTLMSAPAFAAISQGGVSDVRSQSNTQSWQLVQRQISAREAKAKALAYRPGSEFVDIQRTSNAYIVRIIHRGVVIKIVVDAVTGNIR